MLLPDPKGCTCNIAKIAIMMNAGMKNEYI